MTQDTLITQLLSDWRGGDSEALEQLTPIIYQTLHRLSSRHLSGEHNPTLQATELLNEAYIQLIDVDIEWRDRSHFFALASRMMRRLLINRAKARQRQKRGGEYHQVDIDLEQINLAETGEQVLELHETLLRLAEIDSRKSEALELFFFGGLNYKEIACVLSVSEATVDRDLRFAKAWVHNEMHPSDQAPKKF